MTLVWIAVAFVVGALVGANNPLTTKMIANRIKAQGQAVVDKAKDATTTPDAAA